MPPGNKSAARGEEKAYVRTFFPHRKVAEIDGKWYH
jgi:hypothetical protein